MPCGRVSWNSCAHTTSPRGQWGFCDRHNSYRRGQQGEGGGDWVWFLFLDAFMVSQSQWRKDTYLHWISRGTAHWVRFVSQQPFSDTYLSLPLPILRLAHTVVPVSVPVSCSRKAPFWDRRQEASYNELPGILSSCPAWWPKYIKLVQVVGNKSDHHFVLKWTWLYSNKFFLRSHHWDTAFWCHEHESWGDQRSAGV